MSVVENNITFENINSESEANTPAANTPAANTPAANAPAANAPAANTPAANTPAANTPAANAPAANAPAANTPAANAPVANTPAANAPAANTPAANTPASNSSGASPLTNDGSENSIPEGDANTAIVPVPEAAAPPKPPPRNVKPAEEASTPTIPPPAIPPPAIPPPAETKNTNLAKTKRRRSTRQKEADAGQKQMLELLRDIYRKEFADVPERFRPKPKAYVARAAWYKKEGPERDKYIETWILADKDAADARMGVNVGKKRLKEKEEFSNDYVLDTLPSIVSEATGSADKFKPSTDTLKQRARAAIERMKGITEKAYEQLMKRIKQPAVRRSANYLFKETRKLTKRLAAEVNAQTRHLHQAAREYIRRESKAAQGSLEKKAEANLTTALGKRPNKRLTHRLARLRNTGRGIPVKNFLNGENKAGRIPKTLKKNWKTAIPENSTPLNTYND